ncbi:MULTISPECIES: S24 family peptidase [unclassified Halomonas]|uniref:LexA family protein n=1 Tax=unclassified Halomonas TaxID=2609666 RepID=UPI0020766F78|nr:MULTISPECIES: S24 family peptidase [unclassified Halomonas]
MEKHIGDRIRERRKELGYNQPELGKLVGRTKGAVSQWESGQVKPDRDSLIKLESALKCSQSWLMTGKESTSSYPKRESDSELLTVNEQSIGFAPRLQGCCPEISWVQAGQWSEVCDINHDPETTNWFPKPPGASDQTFVLRVVGESMLPDYPPGRFIFVDPEKAADSGDDVIAVMTETNEATFKRLIEEPGSPRMLKALNPAWQNPYLQINGSCHIIGVVIADMRMRNR